MTNPVSVGYPDWNRASAQADVVVVEDLNRTSSVTVSYPLVPVTSIKALYITCLPLTGHLSVDFQFFADAAGTIVIDDYFISARQGDVISSPVKVLGPYVKISVDPGSVTPFTYSLQVTSMPEIGGQSAYVHELALMSKSSVNINPGATLTVDAVSVFAGPAVWSVFGTVASWGAGCVSVDEFGVVTTLDAVNNNYVTGAVRNINLPGTHIRFTITNNSAGVGAFNAFASRAYFER